MSNYDDIKKENIHKWKQENIYTLVSNSWSFMQKLNY